MPHLPRHLLESFKAAYRQEYGEDISDERANELGNLILDTIGEAVVVRARTLRKASASPRDQSAPMTAAKTLVRADTRLHASKKPRNRLFRG